MAELCRSVTDPPGGSQDPRTVMSVDHADDGAPVVSGCASAPASTIWDESSGLGSRPVLQRDLLHGDGSRGITAAETAARSMPHPAAERLRDAIETVRLDVDLVAISAAIWQDHAAGRLDDAEAQALAERVHSRRAALRGSQTASNRPPGRPSIFPPKRPQRSPDRARSLERRRTLAASSPMPPALAARHTTGELAALRIVADEVRGRGVCELCVAAIAARAGVSASTARNAIRTAARSGLLHVEERRRPGQRNDSNRITVVDAAWRAWIARAGRTGGGAFKNFDPTVRVSKIALKRDDLRTPQKGCREQRKAVAGSPYPRI